jgi:hypothetical protein
MTDDCFDRDCSGRGGLLREPSTQAQASSKGAPNPRRILDRTRSRNARRRTPAIAERSRRRPATTTKKSRRRRQATRPATGGAGIDPVPLLSPEEPRETFNLPPGFRAEVVAAEPLVQQPVAMRFDPDGRIWVVEMRGYMPTVDRQG